MSATLSRLLAPERYNRKLRPGLGSSQPLVVKINLNVLSMGPVDEATQSFYLDCYFRQAW